MIPVSNRFCFSLFVLLGITIGLTRCGSSGGGSEGNPELVRVLHAAPDTDEIEVVINEDPADDTASESTARVKSDSIAFKDELVIGALEYQQMSSYEDVLEGDREFTVKRPDSVGALLTESQTIEAGKSYTYVVYEETAEIKTALQVDDREAPAEGKFKLRIANFSPTQATADIYLYRPESSLDDSEVAISALAFKSFSDYLEIEEGSYEVKFTAAGTKDIVEDAGTIELNEGDIATLVLFDKPGGGTPLRTQLYDDEEN